MFEQYGDNYYYVVDESVKRSIPFFWKKKYEMLVAFPEDKKKEEETKVPEFHEQLMGAVHEGSTEVTRANDIGEVLHNLEHRVTSIPYATIQMGNSEEWARKKQRLLQMFERGITVVKQTAQARRSERKTATYDAC